jgi:hypothetical protein
MGADLNRGRGDGAEYDARDYFVMALRALPEHLQPWLNILQNADQPAMRRLRNLAKQATLPPEKIDFGLILQELKDYLEFYARQQAQDYLDVMELSSDMPTAQAIHYIKANFEKYFLELNKLSLLNKNGRTEDAEKSFRNLRNRILFENSTIREFSEARVQVIISALNYLLSYAGANGLVFKEVIKLQNFIFLQPLFSSLTSEEKLAVQIEVDKFEGKSKILARRILAYLK